MSTTVNIGNEHMRRSGFGVDGKAHGTRSRGEGYLQGSNLGHAGRFETLDRRYHIDMAARIGKLEFAPQEQVAHTRRQVF